MLNKSLLFLVLIALVASSCEDEDKQPIITQDQLLFGAFPRLVELRTGEFDLADLSGSAFEMEVDFVDNAGGSDIAEYRVFVSFDDNNADNGDNSTDFALFRSLTPGDFSAGPNGNLGLTLTIPFTEAASFVNVPLENVISGDRFQVRTEVVKTDGRVFSSGNSTPAVTGAFDGIFDFNVNATCPLDDASFVGDYRLTYGEVYDAFPLFDADVQPFGPAPLDKVVTLSTVTGSTTRRSFAIGAYLVPGYNFDAGTVTLDFACDVVTSTNIDSGAGCGSGTIQASQSGTASFELTDDNTFTIEYSDFDPDGGCGVAPIGFSLVFTKQ